MATICASMHQTERIAETKDVFFYLDGLDKEAEKKG
jgi:hypothetical protein